MFKKVTLFLLFFKIKNLYCINNLINKIQNSYNLKKINYAYEILKNSNFEKDFSKNIKNQFKELFDSKKILKDTILVIISIVIYSKLNNSIKVCLKRFFVCDLVYLFYKEIKIKLFLNILVNIKIDEELNNNEHEEQNQLKNKYYEDLENNKDFFLKKLLELQVCKVEYEKNKLFDNYKDSKLYKKIELFLKEEEFDAANKEAILKSLNFFFEFYKEQQFLFNYWF